MIDRIALALKRHFPDPRFEAPRLWSNKELKKCANLVNGSVVNVSGWRDSDKEGGTYKSYFSLASEYWITNWKAEARGWQGNLDHELFLDLETDLPSELIQRFDTVFNHTTLEHVFDVFKAFENLCGLAKNTVIMVVPFLQQQHGEYGDYWRFTPWCLQRLFQRNGFELAYVSDNDGRRDAIYLFAIAVRRPADIARFSALPGNRLEYVTKRFVGEKSVGRLALPILLLRRALQKLTGTR
ncbi:hypothetical protein HC024_08315 [Methylococcaceae bacterium WWC4]|nr:hypothetical protein [Methylococcaceae bacterium WWC4]